MTKKHFIELADVVSSLRPSMTHTVDESGQGPETPEYTMWRTMRDALASFCKRQNSAFDRGRWMSYIDGECGPSGGRVK